MLLMRVDFRIWDLKVGWFSSYELTFPRMNLFSVREQHMYIQAASAPVCIDDANHKFAWVLKL